MNCCCCCCYYCCSHQFKTPLSSWTVSLDSSCSCCSCISTNDQEQETQDASAKVLQSSRGTLLIDDKNIQQESNEPEKMQKKKLLAIEELLQTEHDYVQDLFYLVQVSKDSKKKSNKARALFVSLFFFFDVRCFTSLLVKPIALGN